MFGSPSYTLVKNEDEEDSSKNYVPTGELHQSLGTLWVLKDI